MTPHAAHFPYERRASALFGAIQRPVARVELFSSLFQRWLAYTMVVDTGADYCVLPVSVARDLDVTLAACERHTVSGVGGQQQVFLHRTIRMRLGPWEWLAPVGFLQQEQIPPLLGRYRCLDRFDVRLHAFITTVSPFPPVGPRGLRRR